MDLSKHILVTGNPRSGTTFFGHMLSMALTVGRVHEPFHPTLGVEGFPFVKPYVATGSPYEDRFRQVLPDILSHKARYQRGQGKGRWRPLKALFHQFFPNRLAAYNLYRLSNPLEQRYVIKDPHLGLCTEYIHREFGMACVITIRHPAASVASWKRLGWCADLKSFTDQPLLIDRHFQDDPPFDPPGATNVERAALHWRWCNRVLLDFKKRNPGMLFVRQEDAARDPIGTFRKLYAQLDLTFTKRAKRQIRRHTSSRHRTPKRDSGRPGAVRDRDILCTKRDSRKTISGWKHELTSAEQATVRDITAEVSAAWYGDDEW